MKPHAVSQRVKGLESHPIKEFSLFHDNINEASEDGMNQTIAHESPMPKSKFNPYYDEIKEALDHGESQRSICEMLNSKYGIGVNQSALSSKLKLWSLTDRNSTKILEPFRDVIQNARLQKLTTLAICDLLRNEHSVEATPLMIKKVAKKWKLPIMKIYDLTFLDPYYDEIKDAYEDGMPNAEIINMLKDVHNVIVITRFFQTKSREWAKAEGWTGNSRSGPKVSIVNSFNCCSWIQLINKL